MMIIPQQKAFDMLPKAPFRKYRKGKDALPF